MIMAVAMRAADGSFLPAKQAVVPDNGVGRPAIDAFAERMLKRYRREQEQKAREEQGGEAR